MGVRLKICFILIFIGYYDPDGFLFNTEGFDEFGGYYNEKWVYIPGSNKDDLKVL